MLQAHQAQSIHHLNAANICHALTYLQINQDVWINEECDRYIDGYIDIGVLDRYIDKSIDV